MYKVNISLGGLNVNFKKTTAVPFTFSKFQCATIFDSKLLVLTEVKCLGEAKDQQSYKNHYYPGL